MRPSVPSVGLAAILVASAAALAQDPVAPVPAALLTPELLRVPFSRGPQDGSSEKSALYAARETFKVVVDAAGFEVHPFLGDGAPQSLPLAWRTRSIAIGAQGLPLSSKPALEHGAWECTRQHDAFRERYVIGERGVELSWVFPELPLDAGDLVIEGDVRTPLRASACAPRHGDLDFTDADGNAVMTFGAALAFDGAGRSCAMNTRFDGEGRVALSLDGAWLRTATLPITVDPLIGPTSFGVGGAGGGIASMEAGYQTDSAKHVLVALTRAFSATDHDVYAAVMNADFSSPVRIYSDLAPQYSDRDVCVTYVGGAQRWVIAHQRDYSTAGGGQFASIRMHFHDHDEMIENSGATLTHSGGMGESITRPDLAGPTSGSTDVIGLLVYQCDVTATRANTPNSDVVAVPFNAATAVLSAPFLPGGTPSGSSLDREDPAVNQTSDRNDAYCAIVWSEWDHLVAIEDWDLYIAIASYAGALPYTGPLENGFASRHLRRPKIAGDFGDFLVTYEVSASLALSAAVEIRARAIEWRVGAPVLVAPARTIAGPTSPSTPLVNGDLAVCMFTEAHWYAVFARTQTTSPVVRRSAHAARLGGTGAVVESATLFDDPASSAAIPAVAYDYGNRVGLCIAGSADQYSALLGYRLEFAPGLGTQTLGTGCGPATIATSMPAAGNTQFLTYLFTAPAQSNAVLLISLSAVSIPLDGVGLFGCTLYAAPGNALLAALSVGPIQSSWTALRLPLPDVPLFQGDFVVQWVYTNPGVNPIGLQTTAGMLVRVR